MSERECDLERLFGRYLEFLDAGRVGEAEALMDAHPDLASCREVERRVAELMVAGPTASGAVECSTGSSGGHASKEAASEEVPSASVDVVSPAEAAAGLPTRYQVVEPIGTGGMGQVFRAKDSQLDRDVAIKFPLSWQRATGRGLLDEALVAAKLRSPYICPVYDIGMAGEVPFISMAFIQGEPLSEWLHDRSVTWREACRLVLKIARGLSVAHQAGVVHRDVKPANIMIDQQGEPLIMDFGLAQQSFGTEEEGDVFAGSPSYMAPEQIAQPEDVGWGTDIYGLGVVFYELLTGRVPFQGNLASVWTQILVDRPQPPRQLESDIPPAVDEFCLAMLAKSPGARPASMRQVIDRLEQLLENGGEQVGVVSDRIDVVEGVEENAAIRPARGRGTWKIWWWIAGVATIVLSLALWQNYRPPSSETDPPVVSESHGQQGVFIEHFGVADPLTEGWSVDGDAVSNHMRADGRSWTINADDNTSACCYLRVLSPQELDVVQRDGWRLKARVSIDFSMSVWATTMAVWHRERGFGVCLKRLPNSPDVVIQRRGSEKSWTLPLGGDYHDYVLSFDPASQRAKLTVDGEVVFDEDAGQSVLGVRQVQFGSRDTRGRSISHWEFVEFQTLTP